MDDRYRQAERTQDFELWKHLVPNLSTGLLIEEYNVIYHKLKWLEKQKSFLESVLPVCACGEFATHEPSCEKHQNAKKEYYETLKKYQDDPTKENAWELMQKANPAGHPDKPLDKGLLSSMCYFPFCEIHCEWDYDLPLAFCEIHEEMFRGKNLRITDSREKPRK